MEEICRNSKVLHRSDRGNKAITRKHFSLPLQENGRTQGEKRMIFWFRKEEEGLLKIWVLPGTLYAEFMYESCGPLDWQSSQPMREEVKVSPHIRSDTKPSQASVRRHLARTIFKVISLSAKLPYSFLLHFTPVLLIGCSSPTVKGRFM